MSEISVTVQDCFDFCVCFCAAMAHAHAARERRGDAPRRERQPGEPGERDGRGEPGEKRDGRGGAHYLEDVRTSASQMRRPAEGSFLSWRSVMTPVPAT